MFENILDTTDKKWSDLITKTRKISHSSIKSEIIGWIIMILIVTCGLCFAKWINDLKLMESLGRPQNFLYVYLAIGASSILCVFLLYLFFKFRYSQATLDKEIFHPLHAFLDIRLSPTKKPNPDPFDFFPYLRNSKEYIYQYQKDRKQTKSFLIHCFDSSSSGGKKPGYTGVFTVSTLSIDKDLAFLLSDIPPLNYSSRLVDGVGYDGFKFNETIKADHTEWSLYSKENKLPDKEIIHQIILKLQEYIKNEVLGLQLAVNNGQLAVIFISNNFYDSLDKREYLCLHAHRTESIRRHMIDYLIPEIHDLFKK